MANEEKLIQAHTSPEHNGNFEVAKSAGEQLKSLEKEKQVESASETEPSNQVSAEKAREAVDQEALFAKEVGHESKSANEPEPSRTTNVDRREKQVEYEKTMKSIQSQISKPSRVFSKVIHQPAIEATSQFVGSTVARPNAILAGSLTAFAVVLTVYLLAHYNGFRLSGFETIAAFALGWAAGLAIDLVWSTIKRKRSL